MALARFGSAAWSGMKAGMVLYSVSEPWGHAMLVEPMGDGLAPKMGSQSTNISVFHHAPPLMTQDFRDVDKYHYLGIYNGSARLLDDVLRDVCAAMLQIVALATAKPTIQLRAKPGCYCIAPSGILKPISRSTGDKTTSCTGLVEECYREADITLVEENSLPGRNFDEVRAYSENIDPRLKNRAEAVIRTLLGLRGVPDPIHPLFTSYQMLSFEKDEYPYVVNINDPTDVVAWR
jgi:hypothetical protein